MVLDFGRQSDWLPRRVGENCPRALCLLAAYRLQAHASTVAVHSPKREEPIPSLYL